MGKVKELSYQKRQMVADLHKSGNGYKKMQKWLNILLTTFMAIIKKLQTSGTVANLPGRGCKCMLSPRTVRKMVKEAKKNPRTTVQELQTLVGSWGHKVPKSTIRHHLHTNRLFGRVAQRKPLLRGNQQNQAFWPCTLSACLVSKEGCIQGNAPTVKYGGWIIDALWWFWCQWPRAGVGNPGPGEPQGVLAFVATQ